MGVLTWGHLSHWLLTASCSDIWPQNSAWQRPSNSLRSVRQMHTYSWKQPTHRCTTKFTRSHFFFFYGCFVFADACRCTYKHYSTSFLWFHYKCATAWGFYIIFFSFRDRITVLSSTLLDFWIFLWWDETFSDAHDNQDPHFLVCSTKRPSLSPQNTVNLNNSTVLFLRAHITSYTIHKSQIIPRIVIILIGNTYLVPARTSAAHFILR